MNISSKTFLRFLPPGQLALAIIRLSEYDVRWLLHFSIGCCYAFVLYFLTYRLFKAKIKIEIRNSPSGKSRINKSIVQYIDDRIPVLFLKEVIYLVRSTRIKLILFIGVIFAILYLSGKLFHSADFSYLNLILLNVGALYLTFESISTWLHEGLASRFYFYASLDFKGLIIFKNLAFFFWMMTVELINLGIGFLVKPQFMTFDNIVFTLIFITAFFWLMVIFLNYVAFNWPKKVSYESIFSKSMTASTAVLFVFPTLALFVFFYVPFLFDPVITKLLLFLLFILSIILYSFSISYLQNHMHKCKDAFIETVS